MTKITKGPQDGGPSRPLWKQADIWGIVAFLFVSGAIAGGSIVQYFVREDANRQIEGVQQAYKEAGEARLTALSLCLKQNTTAVNKAASAARDAATKAEAAQQAADKAAAAAESSASQP